MDIVDIMMVAVHWGEHCQGSGTPTPTSTATATVALTTPGRRVYLSIVSKSYS